MKAIPGAGDEAWRLYILAAADPVGNAREVASHIDALLGDTDADGTTLRITSHIPWYLDDHAAAAILLTRCVEVTRAEGGMGGLASYIVPLALTDLWHGRLSDAVMHASEGVRIALEVDQPAQAAVGLGVEALVAAVRGETDRLHERANAAARIVSGGLARALLTWAFGMDALVSGRPDAAYADLRRLFDPGDPAAHREIARWAIADLVEAGVGAGIVGDLEVLAQDAERLASIGGGIRATIVARRARAVLDDGPSNDAFEAAVAVDGAGSWPFELARTRLAYGSWLRRHRQIVAAREPLREAADAFERMGADPWEARARAELRAARRGLGRPDEGRSGRAHAAAAPGGSAGSPGPVEPGDRGAALPVAADDLVPPLQHLPQARRHHAIAARRGDRRRGGRVGRPGARAGSLGRSPAALKRRTVPAAAASAKPWARASGCVGQMRYARRHNCSPPTSP